eukprot:1067710-Rhodomonas_salina.1
MSPKQMSRTGAVPRPEAWSTCNCTRVPGDPGTDRSKLIRRSPKGDRIYPGEPTRSPPRPVPG